MMTDDARAGADDAPLAPRLAGDASLDDVPELAVSPSRHVWLRRSESRESLQWWAPSTLIIRAVCDVGTGRHERLKRPPSEWGF